MRFQNYPSVLSCKESFSIKEFMNKENGNGDFAGSGLSKVGETSPELERLNPHKIVEVNAKLRSPRKHKTVQSTSAKLRTSKTYSIAFNPFMLFDPTFILIGAGVFLVAILEKQLANSGFIFFAAAIDSILKIAFPIVAVGAMIYLFSHSSFLL
jgi:hypothetical protein